MKSYLLSSIQRSCAGRAGRLFGLLILAAGLGRTVPAAAQGAFAVPTNTQAFTERAASYEAQKNITVSTVRFAETKAAALRFVQQRATRLQRQEETPEQLIAEFALPLAAVPALDSLVNTFGYVQANNLDRLSLDVRLQQLQTDVRLDSARLRRQQQQLLLAAADPVRTQEIRTQLEGTEADLRRHRQEQQAVTERGNQAYVLLRLYDEVSFPTANRKVSFVNMPGVEIGYLRVSNPRPGLTATAYQGYSVKYLVTKGKSYFNLGIYKPVNPQAEPADSAFINEMAIINFGQDFYPRNFGRGKRRFFNLYTSYQVGGFIANRQGTHSQFIPNLNLGMGVELVKTKHILLDVKGSYFVPLHGDSRNMRGVLGQGAFNFVF